MDWVLNLPIQNEVLTLCFLHWNKEMFTFILIIDQRIIHLYSLSFVYCHSPGPGQTNGQTVNKTQVISPDNQFFLV